MCPPLRDTVRTLYREMDIVDQTLIELLPFLMEEAGEVAKALRNLTAEVGDADSLATELADVVIVTTRMMQVLGVCVHCTVAETAAKRVKRYKMSGKEAGRV